MSTTNQPSLDSGAGDLFGSLWDLSGLRRLIKLTKTVSKEGEMNPVNIISGPGAVLVEFAIEEGEDLTFELEDIGNVTVTPYSVIPQGKSDWRIGGKAVIGGENKRFNATYSHMTFTGTCQLEDPTTVPSQTD